MGVLARYALRDGVFTLRYALHSVFFMALFIAAYVPLSLNNLFTRLSGAPPTVTLNAVSIALLFNASMIAMLAAAFTSNVVEREKADGVIEYVLASTPLSPREFLEAKMLSSLMLALPVAALYAAAVAYMLAIHNLFDAGLVATAFVYMLLVTLALSVPMLLATLALPQKYTMIARLALVLPPIVLLSQVASMVASSGHVEPSVLYAAAGLASGCILGAAYAVGCAKAQSIVERALA